jgi:hypothetical protein
VLLFLAAAIEFGLNRLGTLAQLGDRRLLVGDPLVEAGEIIDVLRPGALDGHLEFFGRDAVFGLDRRGVLTS